MKLLICAEYFYPSVGGVQEVVRQIAKRMVEDGHQVTVATSSVPNRDGDKYLGVSIKSFDISGNLVNGITGDIASYRDFVKNSDFDLLFIYAAQQWTFDALWEIIPDLKVAKVFVPCGYSGLHNPAYSNYFERLPGILTQFDAIVYHAKKYRDYVYGQVHGLEDRAVIIPNGADDREFLVADEVNVRKKLGIPDDAFVMLTVGTLNGAKGHLEVSMAFEELEFCGRSAVLILNGNRMPRQFGAGSLAHTLRKIVAFLRANGPLRVAKITARMLLSVVGIDSGYFAELEKSMKRINSAQDRKVITCDLERKDLIQAFFASDLFVFASNIEYSPLVLYEACAAGLPFLSVSVGNSVEIAAWTGGGEVILIEPDLDGFTRIPPSLLAENMQRLICDPSHLAALGKAGHEAWRTRFNWGKLADDYKRLFRRVCLQGKSCE